MLKYMPLAGSILLTLIIVWIVVSTVRQNRRRVRLALTGTYYRSTCCGSTATPFGWTQDGWVSTCDNCGEWQYHGDDHDNPPPGFDISGYPSHIAVQLRVDDQVTPALHRARDSFADLEQTLSRHPAPRPAAKSPSLDEPQDLASDGVTKQPEVTSEITPYPQDCTCHPDDRPPICFRRHAASECVAAYRARYPEIAAMWADEGEPLKLPPQPNIGGEDHPPYQGPHYDVPHERFVPYDVIGEPVAGAAVHMIGDTAFAGPLPEIAEWRCVNCKTVVESAIEPERCIECGQQNFVRIDS